MIPAANKDVILKNSVLVFLTLERYTELILNRLVGTDGKPGGGRAAGGCRGGTMQVAFCVRRPDVKFKWEVQ